MAGLRPGAPVGAGGAGFDGHFGGGLQQPDGFLDGSYSNGYGVTHLGHAPIGQDASTGHRYAAAPSSELPASLHPEADMQAVYAQMQAQAQASDRHLQFLHHQAHAQAQAQRQAVAHSDHEFALHSALNGSNFGSYSAALSDHGAHSTAPSTVDLSYAWQAHPGGSGAHPSQVPLFPADGAFGGQFGYGQPFYAAQPFVEPPYEPPPPLWARRANVFG